MRCFTRYSLLSTALLTMTLLAISIGLRLSRGTAARPALGDWDIPQMVDYLNHAGLKVRLLSPRKDGRIDSGGAYLTTTDKSGEDMNWLIMQAKYLEQWRGTVICKHAGTSDPTDLACQLGDPCLVAGPFVFFGDAELLEQIRIILAPSAPLLAHR